MNALFQANAEGMPNSMMAHIIAYESLRDALAERVEDQDAKDPSIRAQFVADHLAMTEAFEALLAARPATAQDQSLRALCLLRRIAEDEISAEDLALFLRSML